MLEARLAARNLLRQPVRSAIALSAIFFGLISLLLSVGFIEWIFWAMQEATVQSRLGHIQIAKAGFFRQAHDDLSFAVLSDHAPELPVIALTPKVRVVTPRLTFSGLVSHGETTVSFIGEGVAPEKEEQVSRFLFIVRGNGLSSADDKGIILGEGLAANLGVDVGDLVVLLTNTPSGGINAVEARVRGLFYTLSKQFDDAALRLPIHLARALLRSSGANLWIVLLDKTENTNDVLTQLKKEFPQNSSNIEFKPWSDLADFYNKTVALYSRQMFFLKIIIGLIIVLSIANTTAMNVLERTGEIGTLMALGTKRKRIMRLFMTEGLILGLIGGLIGLLVGYLLALIISAIGIPMPPAPGMSRGFSGEIRLTLGSAVNAFLIAVSTSLIASLYPAWKASRLNIVDALRHNR
jgi:putative ABC transport system permease protein